MEAVMLSSFLVTNITRFWSWFCLEQLIVAQVTLSALFQKKYNTITFLSLCWPYKLLVKDIRNAENFNNVNILTLESQIVGGKGIN